jgi:DNA-binding transcriptional LysR family regulator
VFTVASVQAKIEAQIRGLGCGFIAEPLAREHIRAGRLVVKAVARGAHRARLSYAWRTGAGGNGRPAAQGLALQWWLEQLARPATRQALLERHPAEWPGAVD